MSIKRKWLSIFSSVKIQENEPLKDWFARIAEKYSNTDNPITIDALRAGWARHGSILFPEIAQRTCVTKYHNESFYQKVQSPDGDGDFRPFTFSDKYEIPDGIDESKEPFIIEAKKMLVVSDIHFPFQDREALMTALTYGEGCDVILLNGDIMDCYSESKFTKNPLHRMLKRELDLVRDFLEYLRSRFPKARIIYKFGNHDKRHQDYLFRNADALSDLDDLLLPSLLRFNLHKIEEVHHTQLIRCGSLNILHGHEYFGGAGTINISRQMLLKTFDNIIVGHFHQTNSYTIRKVNGDLLGAWATGCLCYSEDTEILTQDGFKYFKDVLNSDNIVSYDEKENKLKFSKILARQIYHYEGDMVNFKSNKMDLLVTPEHKMIYKNHSRDNRVREAISLKNANTEYDYYVSAPFYSESSFDIDYSILCAWILTEGSVEKQYNRISIYQKKKEKDELRELLNRIGIEFTESIDKRNGVHKFRINHKWSRKIIEKIWGGKFIKRIPRKILNSDFAILNNVYETLVKTDGHRMKNGGKKGTDFIATICEYLAHDYEEVAIKLGYTVNIVKTTCDTNFKKNSTIYRVRIRKCQVNRCSNIKVQQYCGNVYDFTSETGWLLVRRNGKISISSNCKLRPDYRPFNHWTNGFATVEFSGDKFHVNNHKLMNGKVL